MIVDFIIPGAQKSGTTALMRFLKENPEIGIPQIETNQFIRPRHRDFTAYHAHYSEFGPRKIYGEKAPNYLPFPVVAHRLSEYNPKLKHIIILRDPTPRAYSQFTMRRLRLMNEEVESFSEVIRMEYDAIQQNGGSTSDQIVSRYGYLSRGLYLNQINAYLRHFDRQAFLFLLNEDLAQEHCQTLEKVSHFLEVQSLVPEQSFMRTDYAAPMSGEDEAFLRTFFRQSILELQEFLGRDLSHWL